MADYEGALPQATHETEPFWEGAKAHKLMLPYCAACDAYDFYPRPFCRKCFSWDIEWKEASGKGKIATYVINHRGPRGFEDKAPYVIAVVELEEGPSMMTNLVMDEEPTPENVSVMADVEVVFTDVTDEVTLPHFRLV
jgi:uncharacterized OB-fold protein